MTDLDTAMPLQTAATQPPPRLWGLIPCGGTGTRAGGAGPKQYRVLAGKPMVMHTLAAFSAVTRLSGVVVAVAPDDASLDELFNDSFFVAAQAGNTRAATVFSGLNRLIELGAEPQDWVLVHDAVRCLITPELINTLIDACQDDVVGGLLALPLPDTLKSEHLGRVADTLERDDKWLAQTPQMFRIGALLNALDLAGDLSNAFITDESSAMERLGHAPKLVRGSAQNFKVTYPEDFALAQAVLVGRSLKI